MVNSLLIASYEWFCVFEPVEMSISYKFHIFCDFNTKKQERKKLEMGLNTFYQLDTMYFHLSGKFE